MFGLGGLGQGGDRIPTAFFFGMRDVWVVSTYGDSNPDK